MYNDLWPSLYILISGAILFVDETNISFDGPSSVETRIESFPVPAHTAIFRERRRPGPQGSDTLIDYERDLADAALILQLIDKGALKSSVPSEDPMAPVDFSDPTTRLTEDEEVELTRRVQICADIDARNRLVMANIGLVHMVANQMCRPNLRYDDLLQEGIIGLMRATQSYEPFRNVRFSTYSIYWIRAKIQRHIQKIDKEEIPTIVGAAANIDEQGKKRKPRSRKLSLDKKFDESDGRTFGDTLTASVETPEATFLKRERAKLVREALREAIEEIGDERLNIIVKHRILAETPATLEKVGQLLQFSREGVRLLEARLLKRFKTKIKSLRRVA